MNALLYSSLGGDVSHAPLQKRAKRTEITPSSKVPDETPSHYTFPQTFSIGGKATSHLVTSEQLRAHLALLRSFHDLRQRVEATDFGQVSLTPVESLKDRRWAFFVAFAVKRFEMWSCSLAGISEVIDDLLTPPVDVLMVWHAYRLNPAWYAEDSLRVPAITALEEKAGSWFKTVLNAGEAMVSYLLQGDLDNASISQAQARQWALITGTCFDPFEAILSWTCQIVECPECESRNVAFLLTPEGTGYLQRSFLHRCAACSRSFNHEALAIAKFASNLTFKEGNNQRYLAGTLHTPLNPYNAEGADRVRTFVLSILGSNRLKGSSAQQWRQNIGRSCKWLKSDLSRRLGNLTVYNGGKIKLKMMSAYIDDRPFSVDLVGAVLRQALFIEKMQKLRWTEPSCFSSSEDEITLQHCIARYHAFLDLLSSSTSFLVPTLDIDLAWHTHQLFSYEYSNDTRFYVGRFIDHDDKVESSTLSNAFDLSCRAWEARFNVHYSLCGCPMPGETIGQKMTIAQSNKHRHTPSHLLPPQKGNLLPSTHASEHNSIIVIAHDPSLSRDSINEARRKSWEREQKQRKRREKVKGRKGIGQYPMGTDPFWGSPFLSPVPIYYYGAACSAVPGAVHAGCSSGSCTGGSGCVGSGDGLGGDGTGAVLAAVGVGAIEYALHTQNNVGY